MIAYLLVGAYTLRAGWMMGEAVKRWGWRDPITWITWGAGAFMLTALWHLAR